MQKCHENQRARLEHDPATAPKKFGDLVNAEHIIANREDAMGLTGERDALAIVDRYSNYIDCYPLMKKTADDAYGALLDFFGRARPRYMWTELTGAYPCHQGPPCPTWKGGAFATPEPCIL